MAVFWDVSPCSLVASTSEKLVNLYQTTWCNIPENSRLHTSRRENLKSYLIILRYSGSLSAAVYLINFLCISFSFHHFFAVIFKIYIKY
jgi:hypothetical protein